MLASHWMLTCFFPLRPLNNKNKSLKRKWKLKQKFFVRLRWNLKTRYSLYFSNNFTLLSVAVAIKLSMRASSPAWRAQMTATCTNEAKSIATRKKKTRSILSHVVTSLILIRKFTGVVIVLLSTESQISRFWGTLCWESKSLTILPPPSRTYLFSGDKSVLDCYSILITM